MLLVGYEGTIFRLVLDDSDFEPIREKTHVQLLRDGAPAAARVSVVGGDGKPYGPAGAAIRKTKRGESYFYAEDSFDVELPPGRSEAERQRRPRDDPADGHRGRRQRPPS